MKSESSPSLSVGFLLLDQFTLTAFSGFIDALRLAADVGGRSRQLLCRWEIIGSKSPSSSCGLRVMPDGAQLPQNLNYLAVCGGNGYRDRAIPEWLNGLLHEADEEGVGLIGVCTGTFAIAQAGLMRGAIACLHWNVINEFRERFPHLPAVSDRLFYESGNRITCAGSTGSIDLALHLITRHCGSEKAQQVIRHMMHEEIRPPSAPQTHFYTRLEGVRDGRVRRAAQLMEQTINTPMTIVQIADKVHLSARQLERAFHDTVGVSPMHYYRSLRLSYGAYLLRHTQRRVSDIASDCGFCDTSHFSRHFRKAYECSPRRHRNFSADAAVNQFEIYKRGQD